MKKGLVAGVVGVGIVLVGAWVAWRPRSEPVVSRSEAPTPKLPRWEPLEAAPVEGRAAPDAAARRPVPRFAMRPPAQRPANMRNGHQLAREARPMFAAVTTRARARNMTDAEKKAERACFEELGRRKPELVGSDGWLRGAMAVTLRTSGEVVRAVKVEPVGEEGTEFTECYRQALGWLRDEIPAPGAPDGEVVMEWPFRVGMRPPPR